MNANKITFIRMSCFGYAKNIPLQKNHKNFVKQFKESFGISDTIKDIEFDITLFNNKTKRLFSHQPLNNEEQYTLFIKDEDIITNFSEITGIANFEGSLIEQKDKKSDPVIEQGTILDHYYYEYSDNDNSENNMSQRINEKLMKIEKLKKEIKELQQIYISEIKKNQNYKINEELTYYKKYKYNPYDNDEDKSIEKVKIEFYNQKKNQNIIVKDISEINDIPIQFKVKLEIHNDKEIIPENSILRCISNNQNIFFSNIEFKDKFNIAKFVFNKTIIYVIMIEILFKNKKAIVCGQYFLNLKLMCNSDPKFNKIDIGKIIIEIEDKLKKKKMYKSNF